MFVGVMHALSTVGPGITMPILLTIQYMRCLRVTTTGCCHKCAWHAHNVLPVPLWLLVCTSAVQIGHLLC